MTVLTPRLRTSARRSLFWIGAVTAMLLLATVVLITRGASTPNGVPLAATNPGPSGAMALAEVLTDQGVTVISTDTLDETRAALRPSGGTLLLHDADAYLSEAQLHSLSGLAHHTVLIEPGFTQLQALAPAVATAGTVSGEIAADCTIAAVVRAETVLADGSGYRLIDDQGAHQQCLSSGDDIYSLIQLGEDGAVVTVLGTSAALTNERILEHGNAALALGLLGAEPTLVWYQPGLADLSGIAAPTIAELTPAWLSLVMVLLLLVVIAAGFWKGRRMGPLVVEHLPVTVPASETMEGRARLYQASSARLRALDSLRIGTVSRLAAACGLPRAASVADVVAATAEATGIDQGELRRLLLDAIPGNDRELIHLSDELLTLEATLSLAISPEAPNPSATPDQGE